MIQDYSPYRDYLEAVYAREKERHERKKGAICEVVNLRSEEDLYVVEFKEGPGFENLKLTEGDVVDVSGEHGIVWSLYPFSVAFAEEKRFFEGQRVEVKESDMLFLIRNQMTALDIIESDIHPHFRKIDKLLKGEIVPSPAGSTDLNFINQELNDSQRKAIRRSVSIDPASFFHLIHGPPGTGKTTVIAEVARQLARKGKRVLISSHTNVAVDNAVENIAEEKWLDKIVRLGHPAKMTSGASEVSWERKKREGIYKPTEAYDIVGTTLSKTGTTLLNLNPLSDGLPEPEFDWVIIDESSNATLPRTLLGMMSGERIVLVGDHLQLPPVVKEENLKIDVAPEVKVSPFEKMIGKFPDKATLLDTQYRSNSKILDFSSQEIYRRKVGEKIRSDGSVKNRTLTSAVGGFSVGSEGWLKKVVEPSNVLVWIETSRYGKEGWIDLDGKTSYNLKEAALCSMVMKEFAGYIGYEKIGVITPFRGQKHVLNHMFEKKFKRKQGSEIDTVDSYQGKEEELVIISAVKNSSGSLPIFEDPRRLNVAVTRARSKLVLIGSKRLRNVPCYSRLLKYLWENGVVMEAPDPSEFEREVDKAEKSLKKLTKGGREEKEEEKPQALTKEDRELLKRIRRKR